MVNNEKNRNENDCRNKKQNHLEQNENTSNSATSEEYTWKTILAMVIMFLLMIWGAISTLLVPSLYAEIGSLKSQVTASSDLQKMGLASKQIQEFSDYIDNMNISDGLTAEELVEFEEEYFKFFMAEMINEDATSVYMEKKVVDKLSQALEKTDDEKTQDTIRIMLEAHDEVLGTKEDELKELEDMYTDTKNIQKAIEQSEEIKDRDEHNKI